jgi:ElaB/YqjD/DUF883 family membrane-anchored ribosome-binding protein
MSPEENKTPEEIEAEIEKTRAELGDTVAAAADKADVKKQTKKKADELKEQAQEKVDELKGKVQERADGLKEQAEDLGVGTGEGAGLSQPPRPSPETADTMALAFGAALAGFILGRFSVRGR